VEKILPLEQTKIYNAGSNGKLVFVLDILPYQQFTRN
jgi:hypothetical protein